jgi:hypothetical protein
MELIMVEHFEVFHSVYFHILVSLQLHQLNAHLLFVTNLCHVSVYLIPSGQKSYVIRTQKQLCRRNML